MSTTNLNVDDLPLIYKTPAVWAEQVLEDPIALLNDHAHLEKKAAANALELISRWPDPEPPEHWVKTMTAIASDEVEHLRFVVRLLNQRGGVVTKWHNNMYAGELRKKARVGMTGELVDRLMVSALIEARSCERFAVLAENCDDEELRKLYKGLWASEMGHYLVFIEMATLVEKNEKVVNTRWEEWLKMESEIIEHQAPGPRMHSGVKV